MNAPINFSFTIKRNKRRKSLGLYVENQQVEVRAPFFISEQDINQWVSSKAPWVTQQLLLQNSKAHEKPKIEDQGQLLFFGKSRPLRTVIGKPRVSEGFDNLCISHRKTQSPEAVLEKWLQQEAKLYIEERCMELANEMGFSERINAISFRKTKSKWGHCTSDGRLQFNWLIIMAPVEVIDYLLIHELSHLQHMNHSKAFWQLVANYCPNYKTHKLWLDQNGHRIWL
jgi:predicted metal-dependent hydrolase